MEVAMRSLIRKCVLGSVSVLALGIGGVALDYAADAGDAATAASMRALSQASESWRGDDTFRKDDIRWVQVELRYRDLYKGSLDGVLGPQTKRALARFQKTNGLDQTASIDARTWEALTGYSDVGQGSSMPPNSDRAGRMTNPSIASHLGK
jgi:peptidoglycan hydrolase-like protein with peptidoglycan-binding domain